LLVRRARTAPALTSGLALFLAVGAAAQPSKTDKIEKDGKWETADGTPTFNVAPDGTVDWYTYSGFRRYHSECHVCHGPDGEGSSFAPALDQSVKTQSYQDFLTIVASGRQAVGAASQNVMPALGDNPNVMCYIDDIYVYLKARSEGAVGRGRPAKRADKPAAAEKHEKACFGTK
jgi:methanol metabolism-related c-type cytochrome